MSEASSTTVQPAAAAGDTAQISARDSAAAIDASCRWPVLMLFTSGSLWLVLATLLGLLAAVKFHAPNLLSDCPWLTLGRVRPAAMNALVYGFASQAGIGILLWMLCRLGGVRLAFPWPVLVGWKLWNIGVTVGVLAILAGDSTGFELLEMPRYASGILLIAYLLIGLCAVATFTMRRQRDLFPSQWYLLAALFWFPWVYTVGNGLLVVDSVRGTMQAVVNAWYVGNLLGLWLAPIGLAVIFYFLPKLTGRPLFSGPLAALAFWTFGFFTAWSGLTSLVGAPVPRWMPAVSGAATLCLLVPILCNGWNWYFTHTGNPCAWKKDVVLKFIYAAAACFLVHGLVSIVLVIPRVSELASLTWAIPGRNLFFLHGFVALALFGGIYYILPRVLQAKWSNERWMQIHLLCTVAGAALLFFGLVLGGLVQGSRMADVNMTFVVLPKKMAPFIGLSSLGMLVLLFGQAVFLGNLALLLRDFCRSCCATLCAQCCGSSPATREGGRR